MNPISHLSDFNFSDLDGQQLLDVVYSFVDENNYPRPEEETPLDQYYGYSMGFIKERERTIELFENIYHSINVLENYFNNWNK